MPEGDAVIQRDPQQAGAMGQKEPHEGQQDKCEVLHIGKKNTKHE